MRRLMTCLLALVAVAVGWRLVGHAAAAVPEGLVVFGGAGEDGELADTWLLAF